MARDPDYLSMPEPFRLAFHRALQKIKDWMRYGGEEPEQLFAHQSLKVHLLIGAMTKFDKDEMTDAALESTLEILGDARDAEQAKLLGNPTYGNAARLLVSVIEERKEREQKRRI